MQQHLWKSPDNTGKRWISYSDIAERLPERFNSGGLGKRGGLHGLISFVSYIQLMCETLVGTAVGASVVGAAVGACVVGA